MNIHTRRLARSDMALAARLYALMSSAFDEPQAPLSEAYLAALLASERFWTIAALSGDELLGGVTAHSLYMTRQEASEVFIYDIAVHPSYRRRGVGKALVSTLRAMCAQAGIGVAFVPADNEDTHAIDFYRSLGGIPTPVTLFTFE